MPAPFQVVQEPAPHCRPQAPSEQMKQRILDPFEAVQQRYEAEEERVAAPDDPKEEPHAVLDEDDGWDEVEVHNLTSLLNEREEEIPNAVAEPDPASKDEPPATLQDQDDDFDELCHALEEIIPTSEFTIDC
ncbi:unnamed protein product [Urochloa humidicola]